MSSREVMEDDPDRWYKMVLEDEQEMKSLDGSEEPCIGIVGSATRARMPH